MPTIDPRTRWRPTDGEEGWLLIKDKPAAKGHACLTPDISALHFNDHAWAKKWAWRCPVCGQFYRIRLTSAETLSTPPSEWTKVWPWQTRGLQRRWDRLHPKTLGL